MPSNTGFFNSDANSLIPGIAARSISVLLDGGSAIYGSDAVGGVVNFRTNNDFEGLEVRAQSEIFPQRISGHLHLEYGGHVR